MYEEIKLERITYGIRTALSEHFALASNVEAAKDHIVNQIVVTAKQDILVNKLETKSICYPKDWWQAFKERWFPEFLLDRYPVEYREEKLEARVLLPKISVPDHHEYYLHILKEDYYA